MKTKTCPWQAICALSFLVASLNCVMVIPARADLTSPVSHNRRLIENTQAVAGARFVGLLMIWWPDGVRTTGSGVLISPVHVLTCAHNLYRSDHGGWAKVVGFAPAEDVNIYPFGAAAAINMVVPGSWPANSSEGWIYNIANQYDIGVIRLNIPIGNRVGGWMTPTLWHDDPTFPVLMNGYDGDVEDFNHQFGLRQITRQATVQTKGDFLYRATPQYLTSWYVSGGSSGGPVWYRDNSGFRVIGVSTGAVRGGSVGTRLDDGYYRMVTNFMKATP